MTFNYQLSGTGWAKGRIEIDNKRLDFEVSYLCDPLTEFLEGIISVTPGYAATYTGNDSGNIMEDNETTFIWKGEPWGYSWTIKFNSLDNLNIQIYYFDDIFDEADRGQIALEATCTYFDFVSAIIDELTVLLKKHGIVGYYETWAKQTNFPIAEFIKLKHFIKTQTVLETKTFNPIRPEHRGNETQLTSLDYEINLLTDNTF